MVLSVNNKSFINNLHEEKIDELAFVERLLAYLKETYTNEGTRSNKISLAKRYVVENEMLSPEHATMIRDIELRTKLNRAREERVEPGKMKIKKKVIDLIASFKHCENPELLLIFLLLASGRRVKEFLKGDIKVYDGGIFINKLSKKRGFKPKDPRGYRLKLLDITTPKEFKRLWELFNELNTRKSHESIRKSLSRILSKPLFAPVRRVKDLRSLYVAYLKKYDKEVALMNSNEAIKGFLHHFRKNTSISYNDKFEIVDTVHDSDLANMSKPELRRLLNNRGFNKMNTRGFNSLSKTGLIELLKNN